MSRSIQPPTTHHIRCWPDEFQMVSCGLKTFEIRRNDRDYQEGDVLVIQEWNPETEEYTGVECRRKIGAIVLGPAWDVPPGVVVMSILPLDERLTIQKMVVSRNLKSLQEKLNGDYLADSRFSVVPHTFMIHKMYVSVIVEMEL